MQHLSPCFFLFPVLEPFVCLCSASLPTASLTFQRTGGGTHRCPCLLLSEIENQAFPLPFLAAVSCLRWLIPQLYAQLITMNILY